MHLKKILFLLTLSINAVAQTSIDNLNFETWVTSASGRFEDPTPASIWATPNYAMDLILGNPSTSIVQKSTDMHGGSFAALMKSRTIVGNFVGATLFTGSLDITSPFSPIPKLGVPFTGRPTSLKGWYKYTSVNNDSSSIYVKLTKWNSSTNTRDVVGFIEKRDYSSVNAYTPFELVINYTSTDTPDSITVVFSASAGAEQNKGEVGSSLWIDDVSLNYFPASIEDQKVIQENISMYPNPTVDQLTVISEADISSYAIYSCTGQMVQTAGFNVASKHISLKDLTIGHYMIHFFDSAHHTVGQKLVTKQ